MLRPNYSLLDVQSTMAFRFRRHNICVYRLVYTIIYIYIDIYIHLHVCMYEINTCDLYGDHVIGKMVFQRVSLTISKFIRICQVSKMQQYMVVLFVHIPDPSISWWVFMMSVYDHSLMFSSKLIDIHKTFLKMSIDKNGCFVSHY